MSRVLNLCLLPVWWTACADPAYSVTGSAPDAGGCGSCKLLVDSAVADAIASPDDAGGTVVPPAAESLDGGLSDATAAGAPAWPTSIFGTYAIRMRFFGNDATLSQLALYAHEKIALAVVTRADEDTAAMEFTICRDFAKLQSPLSAELIATTVFAQRLEPIHFTVVQREGTFHTEAAPRLLGYVEENPAACTGATRAPRRPEQVWLSSGQCECVSSAGPPTSVSDCRVLDSDGDGSPGVTVQFSGARGGQDYVRFRDQSQLAEGKLDPHGRHSGLWLENNDYYQLQCASGLCTRTAYRVCKPERNPALFAPLADAPEDGGTWSCEKMLQLVDTGTLFPNDMLAFPDEC